MGITLATTQHNIIKPFRLTVCMSPVHDTKLYNMFNQFLTRATIWALLGVLLVQGDINEGENSGGMSDLEQFRPLEDELLNQFLEKDDGPFERKIKELIAEYLLRATIDSVSGTGNSSSTDDELDDNSRALLQQGNYYQYPPPICQPYMQQQPPPPQYNPQQPPYYPQQYPVQPPYQYPQPGHPPPPAQQAPPPYQPASPPVQQQPQPAYQPAPPPQQPVPAFQPPPAQPTPQRPPPPPPQQQVPVVDLPQDSLTSKADGEQDELGMSETVTSAPMPPAVSSPPATVPTPTQVVYAETTTPVAPTAPRTTALPATTALPTPSMEHVYSQVHKILDNVAVLNLTGVVDSALGIRTPAPTRNFVTGILNTVFCYPANRILGTCRGTRNNPIRTKKTQ